MIMMMMLMMMMMMGAEVARQRKPNLISLRVRVSGFYVQA